MTTTTNRRRLGVETCKRVNLEIRRATKSSGAELKSFDYARVEELAAIGLNNGQIAEALACSERTLYQHRMDDAEFAEAIKRGRALMRERLAGALMASVRRRSLAAQIFMAKVHLRWREQEDAPTQLSPAQLAEAVRDQLRAVDAETPGVQS